MPDEEITVAEIVGDGLRVTRFGCYVRSQAVLRRATMRPEELAHLMRPDFLVRPKVGRSGQEATVEARPATQAAAPAPSAEYPGEAMSLVRLLARCALSRQSDEHQEAQAPPPEETRPEPEQTSQNGAAALGSEEEAGVTETAAPVGELAPEARESPQKRSGGGEAEWLTLLLAERRGRAARRANATKR